MIRALFLIAILLGGPAQAARCFTKFDLALVRPPQTTVIEMKAPAAKLYSMHSIQESHDELLVFVDKEHAFVFIFKDGVSCLGFVNPIDAHEQAMDAIKNSKGV